MTVTYTPIASQTLTSAATSVTFSSIPQDYRDLVLVMQLKADAATGVLIQVNGDTTASNYSYVSMAGVGGNAALSESNSGFWSGFRISAYLNISTNFWNSTLNIMDYSATNKHKSLLARVDSLPDGTQAIVGRYAQTAAVSSVVATLTSGARVFAAGSTFSLYGVAA